MPAQAGIQVFRVGLDSGFRRNDNICLVAPSVTPDLIRNPGARRDGGRPAQAYFTRVRAGARSARAAARLSTANSASAATANATKIWNPSA